MENFTPIAGYDRDGSRIWPIMAWSPEVMRMRMQWRRETNYTLAQATGYSENYMNRLNSPRLKIKDKRNSPSHKILTALSSVLKCFWLVHDTASPFAGLSDPPPGFDRDMGLRWPVLELHPENIKMRMQWLRMMPAYAAQESGLSEELIADLVAGRFDGFGAEDLQEFSRALSCIFIVI